MAVGPPRTYGRRIMGDQSAKGRRAADRRREQQGTIVDGQAEVVEESTTPGGRGRGKDSPTADTATNLPAVSGPHSRTNLTSVGSAAHEIMRQGEPVEATKVRHAIQETQLPGGRLICLEGKDIGKSWDVTHDVMLAGRAHEAQIKLSDNAISRQHFELRYQPDTNRYFFHPLVTDPPPLLNGEEAAGSPRELNDGDVLEVGETTIRFVRVDGPPPEITQQQEASLPAAAVPTGPSFAERTRLVLVRARGNASLMKKAVGLAVLAAVLLVVGSVFAVRWYSGYAREAALSAPDGAYQKLLRQAREQRESRRWKDMLDTAKSLTALAPERSDGARLAEEARAEQLAERNLNLGRMNFTNGNHDAARSALRLIPDPSVYRGERDQLLEKVNLVGRNKSLAHIKELLAQGRYEEAAEAAEQHLLIYPGDTEVSSLRAKAMRGQLAHQASGSSAWQARRQRALQALDVGDFTQAIAMGQGGFGTSDNAMARSFVKKLTELESQWREGKRRVRRKDAGAAKPLARAKDLNRDIAGSNNSLAKDISKALADAYFLAGINAMQAGNECGARGHFERADAERPADTKVLDKLSRLAAKGRHMLGKAEAAKARGDGAAARRFGKEAACRLKKGDADHARAEKLAAGKG